MADEILALSGTEGINNATCPAAAGLEFVCSAASARARRIAAAPNRLGQMEGIARAKTNGIYAGKGRPVSKDASQVRGMKA